MFHLIRRECKPAPIFLYPTLGHSNILKNVGMLKNTKVDKFCHFAWKPGFQAKLRLLYYYVYNSRSWIINVNRGRTISSVYFLFCCCEILNRLKVQFLQTQLSSFSRIYDVGIPIFQQFHGYQEISTK